MNHEDGAATPDTRPFPAGDGTATPDVIVVGAGPAGLIAADALSARGHAVVVLERMPSVGRKLLMAGRGGLNLTHSEAREAFVARYGAAAPRLAPLIEAFPPEALVAWCAGLGIETFTGTSGRVFPRALKASPLLRALLARLAARGVAIRTRWHLAGLSPGGLAVETPTGRLHLPRPPALLLALGGASWPRLGSDGGWAAWLRAAGVPVSALRPANAGLVVGWSASFSARFAGTPLKRIVATAAGASVAGEAMVTAQGLEGGAVYALFASLRDAFDRHGHALVTLDLRPDLDAAELARRLAQPRGKRSLSTHLRKAAGLPPVAVALLSEPAVLGSAMRPQDPVALAALIKALPVPLAGVCGLDRAISTAGGVAFDALDEGLMLTALPGVFVAGEMIDWEAPTGGYLLQASFATGMAAAEGIARHLGTPRRP